MKNYIVEKMKSLLSGFVAGCFIGMGGVAYVSALAFLPKEYSGIIAALLFPIGLLLISFTGSKLYTGRIGYVIDKQEDSVGKRFVELGAILVGNFLGAAMFGFILFAISKNNETLLTIMSNIVNNKTVNRYYGDALIRPLLCGVMVFLAVDLFKQFKNIGCKIIFELIPIFLFCFAGWDHCIANGFYYAAGFMAKKELGLPIDAEMMAWFFVNIFACILGNSIGSIITNLIKKALKITIVH